MTILTIKKYPLENSDALLGVPLGALKQHAIKELQQLKFITEVEVCDVKFIEVGYTYSRPNDTDWKDEALIALKEHEIISIGRYGRWQFQGLAESAEKGLSISEQLTMELASAEPVRL